MPLNTLADIPTKVSDSEIREAAQRRRERMAQEWGLKDEVAVVPSALEIKPPACDIAYHPYEPHPEHLYLAGKAEPKRVLVFDPDEGWILFTHVKGDSETMWDGDTRDPEVVKTETGIDDVRDLKELGPWLAQRRGKKIALLGHDDILSSPADYDLGTIALSPAALDNGLRDRLRGQLNMARVQKDLVELALMRQAAEITAQVYREWMRITMVGKTEKEIGAFIEAQIILRQTRPAYHVIVGVGREAAILHQFDLTNRMARLSDTVLVDAAASSGGYKCDVTRTVPAGQQFKRPQQVDLYSLVLDVQKQAMQEAVKGTEIRELHARAVTRIAEGLVGMGILKGTAAERVEDGSCEELLFTHGLGHMIGIHTHDIGRYCLPGRIPDKTKPGGRRMSVDCKLEPGMVLTDEPGVYFQDWLLMRADIRERFSDALNWAKVDGLLQSGDAGYGVRIEDTIVVAEEGPPINLTEGIPKEVHEVEALRPAA